MAVTLAMADSTYEVKILEAQSKDELQTAINTYLVALWELVEVRMTATPVDPTDENWAEIHYSAIMRKAIV